MTNHWIDYQHSDVMMNIGLNTAENHPVSMKWIERARDKGGKLICVDPRFTRTAALSDLYVPIRPGTNIAFLNGLINYALERDLVHQEYVVNYTNAPLLVNTEYSFRDGMFSGAEMVDDGVGGQRTAYDKKSWSYQTDEEGNVLRDDTLNDPSCVYQLMKQHFSRYDLATVSEITGCPVEKLEECAALFCSTGNPEKAGNVMYAMGVTQFTHGAEGVRAIAILQSILGNMGRPGGGVNAQRGQSNVQGSTDMAMLFHIIPGYMPVPHEKTHPTLEAYHATSPGGYWANRPKFMNSLLKAYWGEHATAANDFCYDYMPKLDKERSHVAAYKWMSKGEIKGMICWADNPAVGGPTAAKKRKASANLDWLVSVDIFENETATFWKEPGVNPADIDTEVFLLPASLHIERDGTISNSGRWIQWRYAAGSSPGDCRPDLWIVDRLFREVREAYRDNGGAFPDPILNMNWNYGEDADSSRVAMEINGYNTQTGQPITSFAQLQDDGSTAAGNWIYAGYFADTENPACKSRIKEKEGIGSHLQWAYAWPINRRIIYNRCSADPAGNAWNPKLPLFQWNGSEWDRFDVPDFNAALSPEDSARNAFIMTGEGRSRLFSSGMAEGPFPEHYEPWESPLANRMSSVQFNPCSTVWYPEDRAAYGGDEFPLIATSYRLSEHYQSGMMTRNMPWLVETMPECFVEISPTLAAAKNLQNGERVIISSQRGEIEAPVCITPRIKAFRAGGKDLEMVGLLWHWGYAGLSKGPIANDLAPSIGDANTTIPEYKAFLCNIRKVV
jgi:formate dehydrogenase major subunit